MRNRVAVSRFDNTTNVLYFGDEIDFRLIPKNCSSTLKVFYSDLYNLEYRKSNPTNPHGYYPNRQTTMGQRARLVRANGGLWRDGALKFVVKRDPVERWLSAINFAILMRDYGLYEDFNNLEWIDKDVNDIAKEMREAGIDNIEEFSLTELFSQTYCAGNVNDYDHVFDIKDFDKCKALMEEILGDTLPDIYATVSKDKSKWHLSDLTSKSIDDIKVLYTKDYTNGWY